MAHHGGAGLAVAGDDIHDAGREDVLAQLAQLQARQGRLLRPLDDHRVARGQCRRCLLGAETERVVERVDLGDDAIGLAQRHVEMPRLTRHALALDFGDEAGEIAVGVGGPFHVAAHARHRIAAVDRIHQRQLVSVFVNCLGQLNEEFRALGYWHCGPRREGVPGGGHSSVHIFLAGQRRFAQHIAIGGVYGGDGLARARLHPLAADEQSLRREAEIRCFC